MTAEDPRGGSAPPPAHTGPGPHAPPEQHRSHRAGWLRAAVLGANDGLVSTASLLMGVAAAGAGRDALLTAGVAGLSAGALSMAAGEYVSVASQRDAEQADLARERREQDADPACELDELTALLEAQGLRPATARQAAIEMTEHDGLAAHARAELGVEPGALARPVQAAVVSALAFSVGALLPVLAAALAGEGVRAAVLVVCTLVALGGLGAWGAALGGAPVGRAALRVLLGGAAAMAVTALVGRLFSVAV